MENRQERLERERKHFKKKMKKNNAHGRNKIRKEWEDEEERSFKKKYSKYNPEDYNDEPDYDDHDN